MIRTYCTITGYELMRGEAFDDFNGMKLAATVHPIFLKTRRELMQIMQHNRVTPEHQIERVLLTNAMLKAIGAITYKTPLLIDNEAGTTSPHINAAFQATCNAFKNINALLDGDNIDRELVKELPHYCVTAENMEDGAALVGFCKELARLAGFKYETKRSSEYDLEEDSFNFRLSLLGMEAGGLAENDKLPKRFTPMIAEWAVNHYCASTGKPRDGAQAKIAYRLLTDKVTERTGSSGLESLREVLGQILPIPSGYDDEKAKTLLTLRALDNKITEYSEMMADILGVPTEIVSSGAGDISWTVVKTTRETESTPTTVKTVSDPKQKSKLKSMLARRLGGRKDEQPKR